MIVDGGSCDNGSLDEERGSEGWITSGGVGIVFITGRGVGFASIVAAGAAGAGVRGLDAIATVDDTDAGTGAGESFFEGMMVVAGRATGDSCCCTAAAGAFGDA